MILAILRLSKNLFLREAAAIYIETGRGMPVLVLILWIYYGLPILFGLTMTAYMAGVLSLTIKWAGYMAENFRSGIQAIDKGQREAAFALGYSRLHTMVRIVLPQAVRIFIPPTGSGFVGMIQDSALVSIIGVNDLIRQSEIANGDMYRPFEIYTITACIYLILTIGISKTNDYIEMKLRRE